jgi:hypothetical protein
MYSVLHAHTEPTICIGAIRYIYLHFVIFIYHTIVQMKAGVYRQWILLFHMTSASLQMNYLVSLLVVLYLF